MLQSEKTEVVETRQARSAPLTEEEVRTLLASVDEVVVAKGKSSRTLAARDATPDELRGPTGGFRAPILRSGRRLLVGFQPQALAAFLG